MPRNLRSTRKGKEPDRDWLKLNEGSPLPAELECADVSSVPVKVNKKKKRAAAKKQNKQKKIVPIPKVLVQPDPDSDEEYCDEVVLAGEIPLANEDKLVDLSSDDDDDLLQAKEKLKELRNKEVVVKKREKLRRIVEESNRLEKSLKKSKGQKSKSSADQLTTSADLRAMKDVVAKVDKLMDRKKLTFKDTSSSEDDSGSEVDSVSSGSCSEKERIKEKKEKTEEKKKSGKEKRLTSYVKYPQEWPHSHLKFHFVAKDKKYDELSLAEFCAGYLTILKLEMSKKSQVKARIDHLEELMYHATTKPWKNILNYHAACLLEIERGNLSWGDNFQLHGLHNTTLNWNSGISNFGNSNSRGSGQSYGGKQYGASNSSATSEDRVYFCRNFQHGECTFGRDHYGQLKGETRLLQHICAKCWLTVRKKLPHSQQSESCPLFKVTF